MMTSIQLLKRFINQRLSAAAAEIFSVCERSLVQEELERQRRLMEVKSKPRIHRAESLQPYVDDQKTSSSLEQEDHEVPHIKEEEDVVEVTVTDGESDDSHDSVRDLTTQLLTAAALEIFFVFKQTVVQYEKELDCRRGLLEGRWNPDIKPERTELPQQSDQDTKCPKQEEPDPPKVKEEPEEPQLLQIEKREEVGTSQEGEPLHLVSQETRGKIVRKRSSLGQHSRTAPDKKKTSCEVCGKNYSRQGELMRHMRTHTGEKPYSCGTCGKRFGVQSTLLVHMRTHTGEKPFTCQTCSKSFSQRSNLLVHMRTHTGEKPYSCEFCGKRFHQQGSMMSHMRTHTGEKPYSCEKCDKSFSHRNSLLHHMKSHKTTKS